MRRAKYFQDSTVERPLRRFCHDYYFQSPVGDPPVEGPSEVWSAGWLDPEARQDFDLLLRDLPRAAESVCRLPLEPPACGDAIVASSSSSSVMGITFLV